MAGLLPLLLTLTFVMQTPAGWEAAYQRVQQLTLAHKTAEAVTVLEGVLKSSPGFDPARYELADAHRMLALEAMMKTPPQDAARRRQLELAAADYRRVAAGASPYAQLAAGRLIDVYGPDELDRPAEVITFARQYVQLSPDAAMGHIALANALQASGQEPAATAAFLAARAAVRAADTKLLATMMVKYVHEAKVSPVADLKALLDWADRTLDRYLRESPKDRDLLLTKAGSAQARADLETDPARKRALSAEAKRAFDRFEAAGNDRSATTPAAPIDFSNLPPPPPPPPPMPAGFDRVMSESDTLIAAKRYAEAAALWEKQIKANPAFPPSHYFRINALVLAGQHAAVDAGLKAARAAIPATATARHQSGVHLLDIVNSNKTISAVDAKLILLEARACLDEAIAKNPADPDPVTFKSLVARAQARFETDPAVIKTLTAEADRLRAKADAMRK